MPAIALIGSSGQRDAPSIALTVIHAPPAKTLGPIHLSDLQRGPGVPAAFLAEILVLFALCVLWGGVVKTRQRLS